MNDLRKRINKWIADSGDDTEELQSAAQIMRDSLLEMSCLNVQVKDRGNSYKAKVEENEKLRATLKEVSGCLTKHGSEKLCDGCLISIADALEEDDNGQ